MLRLSAAGDSEPEQLEDRRGLPRRGQVTDPFSDELFSLEKVLANGSRHLFLEFPDDPLVSDPGEPGRKRCQAPFGAHRLRGQRLETFFGCLYYAALRPSEAVMLREGDLYLPRKGWGRIVLAASASRAAPPGPMTAPRGRNAA